MILLWIFIMNREVDDYAEKMQREHGKEVVSVDWHMKLGLVV